MDEQNRQCSVCASQDALNCCYCDGRETIICRQCSSDHYEGSTYRVHIPLPMSTYGLPRTAGYFERLQIRSINFPSARYELLKNIGKVDKCIEEFERTVETFIVTVNEYKVSMIQKLNEEKAKLERYLQEIVSEVESTLNEDEPMLNSQMARDLRECNSSLSTLQCFKFRVDISEAVSALESICSYLTPVPRLVLPGMDNFTLYLYNVKTAVKESIRLKRSILFEARLCFIKEQTILAVNSTQRDLKEAYTITLPDAVVKEIKPMLSGHKGPGLIAVGEFAYVFGGGCEQCEKLDILTKKWVSLPYLSKGITALSPVLKNDKIYLIEGTDMIEVFSIALQSFQRISVHFNRLHTPLFYFGTSSEIVIVTSTREIGRWAYGDASVKVTQTSKEGLSANNQCPPLVLGNKAFFVGSKGLLDCFELDKKNNQ